jgi:hypothetical protein
MGVAELGGSMRQTPQHFPAFPIDGCNPTGRRSCTASSRYFLPTTDKLYHLSFLVYEGYPSRPATGDTSARIQGASAGGLDVRTPPTRRPTWLGQRRYSTRERISERG